MRRPVRDRIAETLDREKDKNQPGPCSVCGTTTSQGCMDCVIDFEKVIRVCPSPSCRAQHEATPGHFRASENA